MGDVTSPAGNPLTTIAGDAYRVHRVAARVSIIADDYGAVLRTAAALATADDGQHGHGIDAARAIAAGLESDAGGLADRLVSLRSVLDAYGESLHEAQTRIDPLVDRIQQLHDQAETLQERAESSAAAGDAESEQLELSGAMNANRMELEELWQTYDAEFSLWRDAYDDARAALFSGEQLMSPADRAEVLVPTETVVVTFTLPDSIDPDDEEAVAEYVAQIEAQEDGMRELSVADWEANRERYRDTGRSAADAKPRKDARELARAQKIDELVATGLTYDEAAAKAAAWLRTQHALHDPDQVAGGDPEHVDGVGDGGANSAIGGQWSPRVRELDDELDAATGDMDLVDKTRATMNVDLVVVDEDGDPVDEDGPDDEPDDRRDDVDLDEPDEEKPRRDPKRPAEVDEGKTPKASKGGTEVQDRTGTPKNGPSQNEPASSRSGPKNPEPAGRYSGGGKAGGVTLPQGSGTVKYPAFGGAPGGGLGAGGPGQRTR